MTLEKATELIAGTMARMSELYGRPVFDEHLVVQLSGARGRVLSYRGPRIAEVVRRFSDDVGPLRGELRQKPLHPGDFAFSREAEGTSFDAFVLLGEEMYLFCNNTAETMRGIAADPRWLRAQAPFAKLAEAFHADPLVL